MMQKAPPAADPLAAPTAVNQAPDNDNNDSRRRSSLVLELSTALTEVSGVTRVRRRVIAGLIVCVAIWVGQYYIWRNDLLGFLLINVIVHPVIQLWTPLVLGKYAYPKHVISSTCKVLLFLMYAVYTVSMYNSKFTSTAKERQNWYFTLSSVQGGFVHFVFYLEFGLWGQGEKHTPSYIRYLLPVYFGLAFYTTIMQIWSTDEEYSKFIPFVFLVGFIVGIYAICGFDKPIDKVIRDAKTKIEDNGYYFAYLVFLTMITGGSLGAILMLGRSRGVVAQAIMLQAQAFIIIWVTHILAMRSTNTKRFSCLMLIVYLEVDLLQTLLFMGTKVNSSEFLRMVFVAEIAGLWKNSGMTEFVSYCLRIRKTNPYASSESLDVLLKKGMVDTLSEVIAVVVAFIMFLSETLGIDSARPFKISMFNATLNATMWEYEYPQCVVSCGGWYPGLGEPPELKGSSVGRVGTTLGVLLLIRVSMLLLERVLLTRMRERADKNSSHIHPDDAVKSGKTLVVLKTGDEARNVFDEVSTLYVFVSFYIAITGAVTGTQMAVWGGNQGEGVHIEENFSW